MSWRRLLSGPEKAHFWLVLLAMGWGQALVVLSVQILGPGLPEVSEDLDASLSDVQWVLIVFGVTNASLVPLAGRLGDLFDRRTLFLVGALLFTLASILGSRAFNVELLIASRAAQAVGASAILANSLAIAIDVSPPEKRAFAIGFLVMMIGAGVALALILGGFLTTQFGWESTFLVTAGFGATLLALALAALPQASTPKEKGSIDWPGAAILSAGLFSLLLAITKGQDWGWTSGRIVLLFVSAAPLALLFVARELMTSHPLVRLGLFTNRTFAVSNAQALLGFVPMGAFYILFPFYLQGPRSYSAQETGLIMLGFPAGNTLGAIIAGRLGRASSSSVFITASLVAIAVGFLLMAGIEAESGIADLLWRMFICGFGIGAFQSANQNLVMSSVSMEQRGATSGILNMLQNVGINVGTAVAGVVLGTVVANQFTGLGDSLVTPGDFARLAGQPEQRQALSDAFMDGVSRAFLATLAFAALAIPLSLLHRRREIREATKSLAKVEPAGAILAPPIERPLPGQSGDL